MASQNNTQPAPGPHSCEELIEGRIRQWQQGQGQLQARKQKLVGELRTIDADLVANQGAITGAMELLEMVRAAAKAISTGEQDAAPEEAQEERDAADIEMGPGADAARG